MDATQATAAAPESEPPTPTPTPAPQVDPVNDAGRSFPGENKTFNQAGDQVIDPEIAALQAGGVKAVDAYLEKLASTPPKEQPPPEENPTGNPDPNAEPATNPEPEKEPEKNAGEDDPPDVEDLPTRFRLNLSEEDKVGRLASVLKHKNKTWNLEQCVAAARAALSAAEPVADTAPEPGAKPAADAPAAEKPAVEASPDDELTKLDAEIARVTMLSDQAHDEVNIQAMRETGKELAKLREQRLLALIRKERASVDAESKKQEAAAAEAARVAAAQQEYDEKFNANEAKAAALYPSLFSRGEQANAAAIARMQEIDKALAENGDPLYHDPLKPLRVAQMVAAEMNIAPKTGSVKPQPTKAPAKPVGEKSRAPISSGDSRTQTGRTSETDLTQKIASIGKTGFTQDNVDFLRSLGIGGFE